ncbi:hypothetical protein [Mucisphaera sp.]|uniref:hypothetical protein n=1 Tax=Mucisphaera sp. TaxID=2913024 RepID=UPI003D0B3DFA
MRETNTSTRKLFWITPTWGGSPAWRLGDLRNVVAELITRGHNLTILTARAADDAPYPERTRTSAEKPLRPETRALIQFANWARDEISQTPDALSISLSPLVAADIMIPTQGLRAVTLKRQRQHLSAARRRLRQLLHHASPRQVRLRQLERKAMTRQSTHTLIALNQDIWQQIANDPYAPSSPTHTLATPLSLPDLDQATARQTRAQLRHAYRIPEGHAILLYTSMRPDEDRWPLILDAFNRYHRSHPECVLLVATWVGYRLNQSIADRGCRDAVRLIGIPSRLPELIAAADLVIQPSVDPAADLLPPLSLSLAPRLLTSNTSADAYPLKDPRQAMAALPSNATPESTAAAIRSLLETDPAAWPRTATDDICQTVSDFTSQLEAQIHAIK